MKLHEISQGLNKLKALCENDESVTEYLDSVEMQLQEKAKNIFFYMQQFDSNMDTIDKEIKRLTELKKFHSSQYTKLKDYVSYAMTSANIEKIETALVKFSFRKSSSLEITDETKIPAEFKKEKITISIDKNAIKNIIKEGKEVPGAVIKENKNLQIK
jgi:hypothetical protein